MLFRIKGILKYNIITILKSHFFFLQLIINSFNFKNSLIIDPSENEWV